MKALEKDRTRRYETANGFAADVQRYLAGEAVLAHPPSRAYRVKKFVRRHKGRVVATGLVCCAVLAGTAGAAVGLVHARRERAAAVAALAEAEAARQAEQAQAAVAREKEGEANEVVRFLQDQVFAAARPKGVDGGLGKDVTLRHAVVASLPAMRDRFAARPLVEARLRTTLGWTFRALGDNRQAAEQFERAVAVFEAAHGADDPQTLAGVAGLASSYAELGRLAEALALRERVYRTRRRTLPTDDPDTLAAAHNLANSYYFLGRHDEAYELRVQTHEGYKRVRPADHPDILDAAHNLAISISAVNRPVDGQIKLFEEVLATRRRAVPPRRLDFAMTAGVLANVYEGQGRHAEALRLQLEVYQAYSGLLPADHPDVLDAAHNLANSYAQTDQADTALKIREDILATRRRVLPADHLRLRWSLNVLAESYTVAGRHVEAARLYEELWKSRSRVLGADHPEALEALEAVEAVARTLLASGRRAEAAPLLRVCCDANEASPPSDPVGMYNAACRRAIASAADADPCLAADADRAMTWLTKAVAAGYRDRAHMAKDTDLDALRGRADFQKLLASLPEVAPMPRPAK